MTKKKIVDNKRTVATQAGEIIGGMRKRFPDGGEKLKMAGGAVTVTVDEAIARLQTIIDKRAAVTATRGAARAAVADENATLPGLLAFMRALLGYVKFNFGADPEALGDFSLAPPKERRPMTAEEKAIAAVKRDATVKARGIVGTRKRAAVKGAVAATLVRTAATTPEPVR
jgi:hypothetical protein